MDKITDSILLAITAIKSFAKYLLIPSGVIVFLPDNWLLHFRLLEVKNVLGMWIAIAFWISLSIVVIDATSKLWKYIDKKMAIRKQIASLHKILTTLNPTEKYMLYLIYTNDNYYFEAMNASVHKLLELKCITRPSIGTVQGFSYALQPWVDDYFRAHPNYFDDIKQAVETS